MSSFAPILVSVLLALGRVHGNDVTSHNSIEKNAAMSRVEDGHPHMLNHGHHALSQKSRRVQLRDGHADTQIPDIEVPDIKVPKMPDSPVPIVVGPIDAYRATTCVGMLLEHKDHFDKKNLNACMKFMNRICHPGKDQKMDGDANEQTTGMGYCDQWFDFFRKHAKKAEEKKESKKKAQAEASMEAAHAEEETEHEEGDDEKETTTHDDDGKEEDSGDAPASASAAAAEDGQDATEKSTSRQDLPLGIDSDRWHMDADRKVPSQGFRGKPVKHEDMETFTSDWIREFPHHQGQRRDVRKICRERPDNDWCRRHGFFLPRSGATRMTTMCFLVPFVGLMTAHYH